MSNTGGPGSVIDSDPYYFELRELLDGDVDVSAHLTPEVGRALADEIARRVEVEKRAAQAAAAEETAAGQQPDLQERSLPTRMVGAARPRARTRGSTPSAPGTPPSRERTAHAMPQRGAAAPSAPAPPP